MTSFINVPNGTNFNKYQQKCRAILFIFDLKFVGSARYQILLNTVMITIPDNGILLWYSDALKLVGILKNKDLNIGPFNYVTNF